jgi:hypothetical protein
LNNPSDLDNQALKTYYVHGPKFKDMLKVSNLKHCNYILDIPYFSKIPADADVRHSRNSNVKDQLFYDIIRGKEVKTVCLRIDHPDEKSKVCHPKIQITSGAS